MWSVGGRGLGCPRISLYCARNLCSGRSWIAQLYRQAMLDVTANSLNPPFTDGGDDTAEHKW